MEIGVIVLAIFAGLVAIKGFLLQYLWNSFLIGWAGINLPEIGFWRAWLIAIIISLITSGFSSSSSK